jgi:hypothetical protein
MSDVRTASGRAELGGISARNAANALVAIATGVVRDASGALKTFFSALSASAAPLAVEGFVTSSSAQAGTTPSTTASAAGGTAPFAYLWEAVAAPGWTITHPAIATTAFTSPAAEPYTAQTGTFRCKITDASGAVAYTSEVSASIFNLGGGGGGLEAP